MFREEHLACERLSWDARVLHCEGYLSAGPAIEYALEQRGGVDRPGQPAAHVVEAGARDDMIRAHPQSERDEVGGLGSTVRACEDERRRALGHVDGKRVRPGRRRKSPCSVLDD